MSLTLPYPNVPTDGQPLEATTVLANQNAIVAAIQSFDGSQISSKSVVESALADSINPQLRGSETLSNFVYSGCGWSVASGLNGSASGGTIYVNGYRTIVAAVGSNTFTANSDTYIYVDYLGNITYNPVANNAASPSAVANAILIAIVTTGASAILSINQGGVTQTVPVASSVYYSVSDSLGNLIYPTNPTLKTIGYRQITSTLDTGSASPVIAPGLSAACIVPGGSNVEVSFMCGAVANSSANRSSFIYILDGGTITSLSGSTQVQAATVSNANAAANEGCYVTVILSPTRGFHLYSIGYQTDGAGVVYINAGGNSPAYISVKVV